MWSARPRIYKLQLARRLVQVLVIVLILIAPAVARYGNYLAARELDKAIEGWDGTWQGETLQVIDGAMRRLPDGEIERADRMARNRRQVLTYAQSLRGGPWSLELGPLSMTDPLAAAESLAAAKRSTRVLWIGLIVPLVAVLLLGRVFCSWICPMGFLLEMTDKLRRPLAWLELSLQDLQPGRSTKYVLLVLGLVMAAVLSLPLLGYVYPPAIIGRELHDLVFTGFDGAEMGRFGSALSGLTWMSLLLLAVALIEITVSRRWWCRYVCPGGGLYSLLGWLRPVRVRRSEAQCTLCGECDEACHLGLRPMQDAMGIECDNCGQCISRCGDDALDYVVQFRDRGPR